MVTASCGPGHCFEHTGTEVNIQIHRPLPVCSSQHHSLSQLSNYFSFHNILQDKCSTFGAYRTHSPVWNKGNDITGCFRAAVYRKGQTPWNEPKAFTLQSQYAQEELEVIQAAWFLLPVQPAAVVFLLSIHESLAPLRLWHCPISPLSVCLSLALPVSLLRALSLSERWHWETAVTWDDSRSWQGLSKAEAVGRERAFI